MCSDDFSLQNESALLSSDRSVPVKASVKRKNLSERRMIVEGVDTIAGKMTGNFEGADCDGTTFFKMASKRGKRSGEGRRVKDVGRQEMLRKAGAA
jgi:hypothetical protein